jgi:hypothetical protein
MALQSMNKSELEETLAQLLKTSSKSIFLESKIRPMSAGVEAGREAGDESIQK